MSNLAYDLTFNKQFTFKTLTDQIRDTYMLFHQSKRTELLVKFAIFSAELYEVLDKPDHAAKQLSKIAQDIQGAPLYNAIFYE